MSMIVESCWTFALRCAGLDLHAADGVESHPLQKARRVGHSRYRELKKKREGGPPAERVKPR